MLSVFIVLLFTVCAINISNYVSVENDANVALSEIIRQGTNEPTGPTEPTEPTEQPTEPMGEQPIDRPDGGGKIDLRQEHYFIVSFNADGSINSANTAHMFMYTENACKQLATKVFNDELTGGKYDTLRYLKETKSDNLTYVGFVDIKEKLDSFNNFLLISSLVSTGAFLTLFLLIYIGSRVVFKSTEEAYKKQKRFITNASHELKTPLTIISADMDLLEMDYGKNEWSESIRDQIHRLNEMTNQLVTLSKLDEEDKNRFPFNDFSINEVCNKAIEAFAPSFKKEGIKFAHNITGNITMFGNQKLIDELIYIFLDNSLKYTGGEQKASYFVVNQNHKDNIEFRFSNTIDTKDEVDVKQINERFYRSPSAKKEGSGVGLSIAQEIINLHKGNIKIEKNNNSLTFLITFK